MANALCRVQAVDIDNQGLAVYLGVAYSGAEVNGGGGHLDTVLVRVLPDDQPAALRTKLSAAVTAHAATLGWTVAGGDMTLPTFQKG